MRIDCKYTNVVLTQCYVTYYTLQFCVRLCIWVWLVGSKILTGSVFHGIGSLFETHIRSLTRGLVLHVLIRYRFLVLWVFGAGFANRMGPDKPMCLPGRNPHQHKFYCSGILLTYYYDFSHSCLLG